MDKRGLKHSDEDVKFWAEVFVELKMTLDELEKELEISHSTTWWCFIHRLPYIDPDLYDKVIVLLNSHKGRGGRPAA